MTELAVIMRQIRRTRSAPPGRAAADDQRRRRYVAGLEQFEELTRAAEAVAPSARALPLFYALAQAGYAIAAAYLERDNGKLASAHGVTNDEPAASAGALVLRPTKRGAIHDVADALQSPRIPNGITVDQLWSSLPESFEEWFPGSEAKRALVVKPVDSAHDRTYQLTSKAEALLVGLPTELMNDRDPRPSLKKFLESYPTSVEWQIDDAARLMSERGIPGSAVVLYWALQKPTGNGLERRDFLLGVVAPQYGEAEVGWLRPALEPGGDVIHLLVTWWALLFGLSKLARYHPDAWLSMLDVDHSNEATTLEAILHEGLTVVPSLVLNALTGQPILKD